MNRTPPRPNATRLAIALAAVLSLGSVSSARARNPRALARRQLRLGKRLFKQKKYDQAIQAFKRAYGYWGHRVIVFNLALAYAVKGDTVNAAIHARTYLKKAPPGERRLPRILHQALKKTGILLIQVPDPGAEIYVDSRPVGRGRAEVVVLPGTRIIEVRKGDRVLKHKAVAVQAGKETVWELETVDRPPVRPRPTRRASRRRRKRRPRRTARLAEPTKTVAPKPEPEDEPEPTRRSSFGRLHWGYFATALAVTAGALVGASVMSARTRQLHLDLKDDPYNQSLADKGEKYQSIANALWGVTAGCAVGTALIAVFTRWRKKPERTERVSVTPTAGPTGVTVDVRF